MYFLIHFEITKTVIFQLLEYKGEPVFRLSLSTECPSWRTRHRRHHRNAVLGLECYMNQQRFGSSQGEPRP